MTIFKTSLKLQIEQEVEFFKCTFQ